MKKATLIIATLLMAAGCASPKVTRVLPLKASADAPYGNVLVVSLFDSFDTRINLESAIVDQLRSQGIEAVASTSKMTTRTPLNRDTIVEIVEALGSDAVLVTQPVNVGAKPKAQPAGRPEATYNVRSTSYFNVWNVRLEEYEEPTSVKVKFTVVLSVQMYSARTREPVWAVETTSTIKQVMGERVGRTPVLEEAAAIVRAMSRDRLLVR